MPSEARKKTLSKKERLERMEKISEFKALAQPLVDYLYEHYHPHATIIITQTSAEVCEGVMGVPFPPRD